MGGGGLAEGNDQGRTGYDQRWDYERSLRRAVRSMFTVFSFSGDAQRPFGRFGKALKESPLFRQCGGKRAVRYQKRHCIPVDDYRN
jgi:hypothetical protein